MAALRHRARLQRRQPGWQQEVADCDGRVQERALHRRRAPLFMSRAMKTRLLPSILSRARWSAAAVIADCRGIAATEFAMIVPIMLVLFFGTYEFSSGIAVDRKVTLGARTIADLTSQTSSSVADIDLKNFFAASASILTPYSVTPARPVISEIYVDASKVAKIQWSQAATIAVVSGAPQATLQT